MRKIFSLISPAMIVLAFSVDGLANDDCPATLDNLLAQRAHPAYGHYAYEVSDVTGEAHTVERFDPALPEGERWQLLSVNGEAPTDKQLARARKHRENAQEGYRFESLFDEQTMAGIELLERGNARQVYAFTPAPSPDEDEESRAVTRQLKGRLIFEQAPDCFIEYRLNNGRSFKPARGVKIETFALSIQLRALPDSGIFYPVAKDQAITGKAFLVKSIDQVSKTRFIKYELVVSD